MTRWIDPPLEMRTSLKSEFTLAFTIIETERTEVQRFATLEEAFRVRNNIRNAGDFAYVFDPQGTLVQ